MKLNKPANWDDIPAFSGEAQEAITSGGHYLQIMAVREQNGNFQDGRKWAALEICYDFHATDNQAGLILAKYNRNREFRPESDWPAAGRKRVYLPMDDSKEAAKGLKAFITNLEESNAGFTFDFNLDVEPQLRNKVIGGCFREEEYEMNGNTGMTQKLYYWCSAEKVPEIKAPKPKYLDKKPENNLIPSSEPSGLPFDI